jgi:hypothetical protein
VLVSDGVCSLRNQTEIAPMAEVIPFPTPLDPRAATLVAALDAVLAIRNGDIEATLHYMIKAWDALEAWGDAQGA